jgi:hypothetical protein
LLLCVFDSAAGLGFDSAACFLKIDEFPDVVVEYERLNGI